MNKDDFENKSRRNVFYLLLLACVMLLFISINAEGFIDGDFSLVVLLILPVLNGVLALTLLKWRQVWEYWRREKVLFSILLLSLFFLLFSTARYGGFRTLLVFAPALLVAGVWKLTARIGWKGMELTSVIIGLLLILESIGVLAHPMIISVQAFRPGYVLAIALLKLLALILLAVMVYQFGREENQHSGRHQAALVAVVIFVLFAIGAAELRYGVLVKATGRAAEDHAPLIGVSLGIVAGMVLVGVSKGSGKTLAFLYLILVPTILIASFAAGWLVDPHGITSRRADSIHKAVESYRLKNGVFPTRLDDLTPDYIPLILGPLNGRGQVWCYQGGNEFFRLGYVFYERYHAETFPYPYTEVRIHSQFGQPPKGEWMCDQELEMHSLTLGL